MNLREIKVLIIDDDVKKGFAVLRGLKKIGISKFTQVEYQEKAFEKIYEAYEISAPYNLIITDMNYPIGKMDRADARAGFKLIERMKNEGVDIPVIVCSSDRYDIEGAIDTIWYNERVRDLNDDLREALQKLI